jgi:hypothetical protein
MVMRSPRSPVCRQDYRGGAARARPRTLYSPFGRGVEMSGPGRWALAAALWFLLSVAHAAAVDTQALPRNMAWSAYNLGTTGYNQAVAIGKVLKDHYDVTLRVLPGQNDVSRLLPLVRGRVQFSANGIATIFAQEGVFQFADPAWGPLPLRLVMTSNGDSNQALAVAADTGVTDVRRAARPAGAVRARCAGAERFHRSAAGLRRAHLGRRAAGRVPRLRRHVDRHRQRSGRRRLRHHGERSHTPSRGVAPRHLLAAGPTTMPRAGPP